MNELTDYELIKNKNYYELWERYSALFLTFYNKVPKSVRTQLWENFDEFRQDCFPILVAAVDSEKLERVKNPETFRLYIQLYHYLMNFTTRTAQKIMRMPRIEHYEDLRTEKGDLEEHLDFLEDKRGSGYEALYNSLTKEERFVFDSRLDGVAWKDIQEQLGYTATKRIRESLEEAITNYYENGEIL